MAGGERVAVDRHSCEECSHLHQGRTCCEALRQACRVEAVMPGKFCQHALRVVSSGRRNLLYQPGHPCMAMLWDGCSTAPSRAYADLWQPCCGCRECSARGQGFSQPVAR